MSCGVWGKATFHVMANIRYLTPTGLGMKERALVPEQPESGVSAAAMCMMHGSE